MILVHLRVAFLKKAKKDNHAYSGKLCHEYIDEIIDTCKKEQKK